MNEYLFYALLGIAAIALIAMFYWLIKVRPVIQGLKSSIRAKIELVKEQNERIEGANVAFRMRVVARKIDYIPPVMADEIQKLSAVVKEEEADLSKLTFPSVEDAQWLKKHDEHYEVGEREDGFFGLLLSWSDVIYHWLWRGPRAIIVFNHDRIIATLLPRPRGSIATLEKLDDGWEKLTNHQRDLLNLLKKVPESAEFLDAKEKIRLKKKEEQERQEEALATIAQAKQRLEDSVGNLRSRPFPPSIQVGEPPVFAESSNLTLAMVEKYYRAGVKAVSAMEERGANPTEIVAYITKALLPNLERIFEEKAKAAIKAEYSAGELHGRIRRLSEEAGVAISVPKALVEALNHLESNIPMLWSQAKWVEFDRLLESLFETLVEGDSFLSEMEGWLDEIQLIRARIAGVCAKETRLKQSYGLEVAVSPDWERTVASFDTEALKLWSEARLDELDNYLKAVETPLRQHQFKVTNRLAEADREAGVSAPTEEEDFRGKLATLAASAEMHPSGSSLRKHQPEPQRRLSGKLVKHRTALGVEIEVDASLLDHFKALDEKQSKPP